MAEQERNKTAEAEKEQKLEEFDNESLRQFALRKRAIELELNQIERKFANGSADNFKLLRQSMASRIIPVRRILNEPLKSVGIAALAGFAVGILPALFKKGSGRKEERESRRSRSDDYDRRERRAYENPKVSSLVLNELKRSVAKRAVHYVVDMVDENLSRRLHRQDPEPIPRDQFTTSHPEAAGERSSGSRV